MNTKVILSFVLMMTMSFGFAQTKEELQAIDEIAPKGVAAGERYAAPQMSALSK